MLLEIKPARVYDKSRADTIHWTMQKTSQQSEKKATSAASQHLLILERQEEVPPVPNWFLVCCVWDKNM